MLSPMNGQQQLSTNNSVSTRRKLDLIRSSLQPFHQSWAAQLGEGVDEEQEEEDEEEEGEGEEGPLEDWMLDMIRALEERGYDRETAYYALKLVNFRSVLEALEVLSSVKQNLVQRQQHAGDASATALSGHGNPNNQQNQHQTGGIDLLPPPDPMPSSSNAQRHSPGTSQQHTLRHSQSFDPADFPQVRLLGTVIRIGRNQSERTQRKDRDQQLAQNQQQQRRPSNQAGMPPPAEQVIVCRSPMRSSPQSAHVQRILVESTVRSVAAPEEEVKPPPDYDHSHSVGMDQLTAQMSTTRFPVPGSSSAAAVPSPPRRCVSPLPESVARRLKAGTYRREVRPCRAPMFRFFMEQHIEKLSQQYQERNKRVLQLSKEMETAGLADQVKDNMLRLLRQKESKYLRMGRQKINREMFELIRHIGIGAFGKVTLVRKKDTNQVYAMKALVKADVIQKQQAAHVKAERDILAEANSPWIVKLFFSFQDAENLYFIMEYVPGGDMMQLLINMGVFPESLARFYIAELTLAVEYVHSLGFIHRDIKPDNILIDKGGHIKLTDFGLCTGLRWTHDRRHYVAYDEQQAGEPGAVTHLRDDSFSLPPGMSPQAKLLELRHHRRRDRAHSVVGTGNYMAPEVIQRTGHTQLCDWWSVGVILYEMVYGRPPFLSQRDDPAETQYKIVHWRNFLDLGNHRMGARLTRDCVDCIARLCCDQQNRLGHRHGARDVKGHGWFKGVDFPKLRNTTPEYVPRVQHQEDTSNFDTFEVRTDELMRAAHGARDCHGKPLPPNFIDFTFRHFFSDGMGGPPASRGQQPRPSLAPLLESSAGRDSLPSQQPFRSSKKSPAPAAPTGPAGGSATTVIQIGPPTARRKTEFSRQPVQARLDERDELALSEEEAD